VNATTTALPVMVGLFRWLTMLAWLIWFAVYWGAGTRSFITHAGHSSPRDRISMLVMAFGALGLFGRMVIVLSAVLVLEATDRPGGRMTTDTLDDYVIEHPAAIHGR